MICKSGWKTIAAVLILAFPQAGICSSLTNAEVFFDRGRFHFARKEYAKAAVFFELAMQRDPGNAEALYYDALTYQQAGDINRAKALYKHTLAIFPKTKAAYYSFLALKGLETQKPVVKPPDLALAGPVKPAQPAEKPPAKPAAQPESVADIIKKAHVLLEDGRPNEAERYYEEALHQAEKGGQGDPRIAEALQALAAYYVDVGSYGKACDLFRRELRIREQCMRQNPNDLAAVMTRQAVIYTKAGEVSTSEELLRRCVDIYQADFDNAESHHKRTTLQRQNLISAKTSLAGLLRATNRAGEAKVMEQEIRILMPP